MFDVTTLWCLASDRPYAATDLARALRWASRESAYLALVDLSPSGSIAIPPDLAGFCAAIHPPQRSPVADRLRGFWAAHAARKALDQGVRFQQCIFLDDRCLALRPGLDVWARERLSRSGLGLLGVASKWPAGADAYESCAPQMDAWNMPHADYSPSGQTLCDAFLALSGELATRLHQRGLLAPEGFEDWPLSHGVYLSWAAQMLGFYQVEWGGQTQPLPPLYAGCESQAPHPTPHILAPGFLLYYPASRSTLPEEHLREQFKRVRGEAAQELPPQRPTVSPQQEGPTVLG